MKDLKNEVMENLTALTVASHDGFQDIITLLDVQSVKKVDILTES